MAWGPGGLGFGGVRGVCGWQVVRRFRFRVEGLGLRV